MSVTNKQIALATVLAAAYQWVEGNEETNPVACVAMEASIMLLAEDLDEDSRIGTLRALQERLNGITDET